MASPLALPLWWVPGPHHLLQFPWRWLLPGTLLLVTAIAEAPGRRAVGFATMLVPLLFMPWAPWVRVPNLDASLTWKEAGSSLMDSIGGNPFLVDVRQHRPPAFTDLERNLRSFGPARHVVIIGEGEVVEIRRWSPLRREVEVRGGQPFVVAFRILDYPFWSVSADEGRLVESELAPGVVSCRVPHGRHILRVSWVGNPLSAVGQIVALLTVLVAVLWRRLRIGLGP
jgi:hypothetical protein